MNRYMDWVKFSLILEEFFERLIAPSSASGLMPADAAVTKANQVVLLLLELWMPDEKFDRPAQVRWCIHIACMLHVRGM